MWPRTARGTRLLEHLDVEGDALAAHPIENGQERVAFRAHVLLGVHPAVHRERAGVGHDVEVAAGLDAPADQHQRAARLGGCQVEARPPPAHPPGQGLERLHDPDRVVERVAALVHQADVRLPSVDRDPQRDRPAARVPHDPARGLGGQHADAVLAQAADPREVPDPRRPPVSSSGTKTRPTRPSSGTPTFRRATAA